MKPQAFHPFARVLHWLMAVLILAMLFIGVSMVADLSLRHPVLISLHKATGLALLVLVVLRIAVRLTLPHPPLPNDLPKLQRWAAGASHLLLYGLMLAMPLLGWAMLSAGDYPRPLGLPAIAPTTCSYMLCCARPMAGPATCCSPRCWCMWGPL